MILSLFDLKEVDKKRFFHDVIPHDSEELYIFITAGPILAYNNIN